MADRFANLRRIEALDPVTGHQEILRITAGYEFPWDYVKSLEFALFRTYCVPSISGLLARTREFERRPQRRYDDTALLMAELIDHGYDSPRGREALRVVNRLHGRFEITNDDMKYVLSTFVFDPVDWLDAYGWRPLVEQERQASFHFYRAVGVRMAIKDLPGTYAEFREFKDAYERREFVYSETNRRIGQYTVDLFCSWYPYVPKALTSQAVLSFLDEPMSRAFGFTRPPAAVGALARGTLRLRSRIVRRLPARTAPPAPRAALTDQPKNRTYPGYPTGYEPSGLGAE
ncbi:oxygenase MpaB family protein [Saccharothrix violaceirubra]|uniref:ER-bound oxygenase mpaB/mpaB'/Rubber oxygenase catalytic domain-containing protein n=1 Tax=Saccharothrix violaceirubra TaxID=413306 RepID=A0A7W7T789_9PSEU|nr:oxygenase MpaB family protein [Saccharothrix violaceirubra]MBB4967836.1 hypothetical protein [Saccharothrix violaceirubra]